ncbi:YhcN/YlaJ family sporulation lipoprotein [Anoxybacillus sp. J5B_2022]|uniref:YhcN/YlaJ family sporulation lipoprotein n=1 Tax=Anoxybacillus sp. J5B_2022 TaxID=3003246 RepID=UPI002285B8E2|nr:YhcN/YlaJ family sporulation lipoprotein [Anoxybacillus sp. J5B_2022]MCZ0754237.1 YhcN/YlaJ family sporulation lipoprotein [Anoxybacillus sp. J5B_2022]
MNRYSALVATSLFFILTGCNIGNRQDTPNESLVRVKNTVSENVQNKSGQQIAHHLADLANRVPNVEDATVLVVGKYAIVGIDVNDKLDRSRVGTVKYSVAESLQKDPYGANAIIIADPDLYTRLQNIVRQVDNGRPVQAFMNEVADIVGRVMPEIPSDLLQTKNPAPTKENNAELNKKEEKQLNNRQDKQSNHYLNE